MGALRALVAAQDATACKRCERCFTANFGCTNATCYCHTHKLEPTTTVIRKLHVRTDAECIWSGAKDNDPRARCELCRA